MSFMNWVIGKALIKGKTDFDKNSPPDYEKARIQDYKSGQMYAAEVNL